MFSSLLRSVRVYLMAQCAAVVVVLLSLMAQCAAVEVVLLSLTLEPGQLAGPLALPQG